MHFQFPPGFGLEARRVAGLYLGALGGGAIALTAAHAAVFSQPIADAPAPVTPAAPASAPAAQAAPLAPVAIAFQSPVPGEAIDSPFGLRRLPWEAAGRLHAGVDIAASSGSPIHATADGVVVEAGQSPSYGHFVEIRHAGGLTSKYAHMGSQAAGLRPGAPIARGQVIGFVGNTGRSTGAHLHFEIRKGDRPLDPAQFVGHAFARLADLPIARAGRVPRFVRVAYVSRWPDEVAPAKAKDRADLQLASATTSLTAPATGGRVRAVITPSQDGMKVAMAGPGEPVPYEVIGGSKRGSAQASVAKLQRVSAVVEVRPDAVAARPASTAGN